MKPSAIALIITALFLAGCDVFHGVSWDAPVVTMPSGECIEKSLHAVAAISEIETLHSEPGSIHFGYRGDRVWGNVHVTSKPNGPAVFEIASIWLNRIPSEFEIDTQRQVSAQIFKNLKERCPDTLQWSAVHETRD